jgi:glycosyltransferase involved in cell wall biosynthesis
MATTDLNPGLSAAECGASPTAPLGAARRKVCIVSWAPFLGGAEIAAERLAVGLQDAGREVLVVLGNAGSVLERMQAAGLRCLHTPIHFTDKWHWLRYWRARNRLRRLLELERPDIVHSNDLPTHQIVSDALRGTGIPEVCHHRWVFDGPAIDWLDKYGCERHLFVSRALMEELCNRSDRLRSRSRAVVYDGLPLPPAPTSEDRCRAQAGLGLPAGRLLVTFAGQIIERKGVADLLESWALLQKKWRERADLVIVGDDLQGEGKYRVAMELLAAELNCKPRFVGFQKEVGAWLVASDVAVVPSHVEPLGNATLEAMSFALPVIGSAVGGIPEMVVPEETGLLVPPRNPEQLAAALDRLLGDEALRVRLGRNGRERCETHFSLAAHTRAVLNEYRAVLPTPKLAGAP